MNKYKLIYNEFTRTVFANEDTLETAKSDFAVDIVDIQMSNEGKGAYHYEDIADPAFAPDEGYEYELQLRQEKVFEKMAVEKIG